MIAKGVFFSESVIRFSNLQKKISQISILSLKFEILFSVIGGKLKFHVEDSDLEYNFWRFSDFQI
jgi:hypothetical protein